MMKTISAVNVDKQVKLSYNEKKLYPILSKVIFPEYLTSHI